MKQVLATGGGVSIVDVPPPSVEPGTVLVATEYSCISVGTELAGVERAETPLWRKALQDPAKLKRVVQMTTTEGLAHTREIIRGKAGAGSPLGYSVAGTVLAVGAGVEDLIAGDRVACAGAGVANHAEVVRVPRNLTVAVPSEVSLADASAVTLGAIALQGVRRANPTLGETFVVLGLGVLGQLTVQLLKANGCRVIATDVSLERIDTAKHLGADLVVHTDNGDVVDQASRLTRGVGADGVIITAATASDEVVSAAFRFCRRKGRVVLVGDVGLNLKREDFYVKELDLLISTSYGPGRYDRRFEEEGLDYPIGYVRWTENRNMAEVLQLIAEGRLLIQPLVGRVAPVDEAPQVYAALQDPASRPLMALLHYPRPSEQRLTKRVSVASSPSRSGLVRLAVVGAGSFAQGVHLPNLRRNRRYEVRAVVTRTGSTASAVAKQYGAQYAATDPDEVLADPDVDAVLIATRHDSHGDLTLRALHAGKHVLVEKPLTLDRDDLAAIAQFYGRGDTERHPVLLTGYNRRFSPFLRELHQQLSGRAPVVINYRMNAGYIPADHWTQGPYGGGRNIGEACHVYDVFTYLLDSIVLGVSAASAIDSAGYYSRNDNFVATLAFEDGSIATLTYTAMGTAKHPKERVDVYCDGHVFSIEDYSRLDVAGALSPLVERKTPDKGHVAELDAFAEAVLDGKPWPIALWQQLQASEIAFRVEDALRDTGA